MKRMLQTLLQTPLQLYKQAASRRRRTTRRHLLVFMKSHVCSLLLCLSKSFLVGRDNNDDVSPETESWRTAAGAEQLSRSDAAVE